jgi:hypothetical protein
VVEEERDRLVNLGALDQVPVVEDEDERIADWLQLVDQRRQDALEQRRSRSREQREGLGADIGLDRADRLDGVRPEPDRIVVPGIDREPGERSRPAVELLPGGEERRLAPPCRRRDESELPAPVCAELLDEGRTRNEIAARGRAAKLRDEQPRSRPGPPRGSAILPRLGGSGADGSLLSIDREEVNEVVRA